VEFLPHKPSEWRVRFRCLPRVARSCHARRATASPKREIDMWPLALRLEAVRRVMANPKAVARRLARRLRRDPPCAQRLLVYPAGAEHVIGAETRGAIQAALTASCADTS